jgi:hypothetical protein
MQTGEENNSATAVLTATLGNFTALIRIIEVLARPSIIQQCRSSIKEEVCKLTSDAENP